MEWIQDKISAVVSLCDWVSFTILFLQAMRWQYKDNNNTIISKTENYTLLVLQTQSFTFFKTSSFFVSLITRYNEIDANVIVHNSECNQNEVE